MRVPAVVLIGVMAFCAASPAVGQPAIPPSNPQFGSQCETAATETAEALEARKTALEREIARKKADLETQSAKNPAPAVAKALNDSLQKSQEDLLDVVFKIDCVQSRKAKTAESRPRTARSVNAPQVVEVTTYYATNRNNSGNKEPMKVYGAEVATTLSFGRALVTIPLTHKPGSIELPTIWKLEREPDPNKHFVLKSVAPLDLDLVRREMREKLQGLSSKSVLVFVHGYNMGFPEAALRTAQLAHDLKFPGMAFFYSWPSASRVRGYLQDEETARLSESSFEQLIEEVSQLPVEDVYVIAHSMGNRIVGHALQRRKDKGKDTKHLRELLLAAPDINADIFRREIAPALASLQGTRTTVYASSSDIALKASKVVHGFKRVGETTGGVFTYPGFDTIDASSASVMTRNYGHSYLMDSPSLLKDIQSIIKDKAAAGQRGLSAVGKAPENYWKLAQ
jgi:esterase/lipase superfamily enzyme